MTLAVGENFFQHDIKRAVVAAGPADKLLEAADILLRIEQAVDVVEAQSLQLILPNEPLHELVYVAERAGVLDAQPGQFVDVEEAPVVDVGNGEPPVGEPIVLPFQQAVQPSDARFVVRAIGAKPALDDRAPRRRARRALASTRGLARMKALPAAHTRWRSPAIRVRPVPSSPPRPLRRS